MSKFVITTDTTSDLWDEFYAENNIDVVAMPYMIGGLEYNIERFLSYPEFYKLMREGATPTTGQTSIAEAEKIFEKHLAAGEDVLYICFSSGMSGSYSGLQMISNQLLEKYPDRRIEIIDSLCGAGGEGLMTYYANKMKQAGATLDEIAAWCNSNKLNIHHFFIVDDLGNLRRGGRISKIEALLGTVLGIRPVLELSAQGRIVPVAKERGLNRAMQSMCAMAKKHYIAELNDFVMISHGDSPEKAKVFGEAIKQAIGVDKIIYNNVNYLVGSHAGPGSLAVFFVGTSRIR